MSGPFGSGLAPVLFVSNYAQATVTGIPLGLIQPGIPVCTAVQELNDDTSQRVYMMTGKNPTGVAMEYWGSPFGALVNQGDNTFQVFDTSTLQPFNRLGLGTLSPSYQVGENPVDCSWSPILPGGLVFAYIANQGGPQNPEGSVSLWWNQTSLIGLFNSNSGSVATTVRDGMNVPGAVTSDPRSLNFWVPNTAGNEILRVDIAIVGGYLGQAISTSIGMERSIGPNPTKVAFTGVSGVNLNFVTLAGLGQVAVFEQSSGIGPVTMYPVPGCRSAFSRWDQ